MIFPVSSIAYGLYSERSLLFISLAVGVGLAIFLILGRFSFGEGGGVVGLARGKFVSG